MLVGNSTVGMLSQASRPDDAVPDRGDCAEPASAACARAASDSVVDEPSEPSDARAETASGAIEAGDSTATSGADAEPLGTSSALASASGVVTALGESVVVGDGIGFVDDSGAVGETF